LIRSISEIARSLNLSCADYEVGRLQEVRSSFTGKRQMRSVIFDVPSKGVNEEAGWAFHYGGRSEIQFNIGFEADFDRFRFGLAFSLEPSQFVSDVVAQLAPKVERFNELVRSEPDLFSEWRMWVWCGSQLLKPETAVRFITADEMKSGNFIFLGRHVKTHSIDIPNVLKTFDELMPVYRFVEGHPEALINLRDDVSGFSFYERFEVPEGDVTDRSPQQATSVNLRSRWLTVALRHVLKEEQPEARFGTEIPSGSGGRIDLVVKTIDGFFDLYEVKPATAARHAIRQALPQLLEYAFRSENPKVRNLYIVSDGQLDNVSENFLSKLRARNIPIYYRHIPVSRP
jgi:hypothetical protein